MLILLTLCLLNPPQTNDPHKVITHFFEAFNQHDPDAMATLMHPQIAWLGIKDDQVSVEMQGADTIKTSMVGYFKQLPTVRSEIQSYAVTGNFISVSERVTWKNKKGETRSQQSLSVYQITEGKIRRVWYYPSSE